MLRPRIERLSPVVSEQTIASVYIAACRWNIALMGINAVETNSDTIKTAGRVYEQQARM